VHNASISLINPADIYKERFMRPYLAEVIQPHSWSDFGKFWIGQTVSTLGSSFTTFALPLLIFKLTGSPLNLALTLTFTVLPYLLFGLIIGAWVDRVDRKRLMVWSDLGRACVVASIPFAFFAGFLSVWWIYVVTFLTSTLTICFDAANFAAIPAMVSQEEIVAANGQLQAAYSTARILGPLLGGILIAVFPLPTLLLIDAISFLVSVGSLLLINTSFNTSSVEQQVSTSIYEAIVEGLRYVLKHPILFWTTLLLLFVNFISPTVSVELVFFAKSWFMASDTQVGLLYAGGSLGTVIFSLVVGRLRKLWPLGTIALWGLVLQGIFVAIPAVTHWYWALLLCWTLQSGANVLFMINSYSMTQMAVPNQLLGRVITFIRVLTWSAGSLGALLGGFAIIWTNNVALVYAIVGLLISGITLAFFLTPLGHSEQYLPKQIKISE
jgi:MFS family permease